MHGSSEADKDVVDRVRAELLFQLGRCANCADSTRNHDRDAVAVLRFVHVMGCDKDSRSRGRGFVDELPELPARDGIDAARWLIEKDDPGLVKQGD